MSKKTGKKKQDPLIQGVLDITRSGIGYVITEGRDTDVLVRPNDFNRAMHGDTVRVKLKKSNGRRAEGVIEEVVDRKQTEFIGNIEVKENFAFFRPDSQRPIPDFYISTRNLSGAKDNDRVVVRLLNWEKGEKKPEGEVVTVLQARDKSDMAMKEILIQNGFPLEFPKIVLDEANELKESIDETELAKRRDYRNVLTFTIDPADAKDFDDALSIQKVGKDEYEIGVHIADVSHFVKPGSELDKEGYSRATSVYLPDRVNPMLPEKISNELCSLRPDEDKYTFSVIFIINNKGKVKDYWLGKTFIHSDHRFNYDEVQEIIETNTGKYVEEIQYLNSLAKHYRKERFKNGAINFSSTEVKFQLDETGKPIGIVVKESKESHQLIEEFMLLANRTVAAHVDKIKIDKKPIPFPYRIHDTPDEEKLKPFVAFAKKFGYKFNMNNEAEVAASFNQLLKDVHGKPEQHVLEQLGIRTMAKAIYTSENIGHYGLGFEHYCHFTSPIRRYPDVMVHRILQDVIERKVHPDNKMEEKCRHCSAKERSAMDSERAGNKYKQVEFMMDKVGEDMEGVISGVAAFGFWVETVNEKCEGLVSARDLSDYDDFRHDDTDYALVGLRTGKKFRMGDKIKIKLVAANLEKRQLDFEWIPGVENLRVKAVKKKKMKIKR
ncbi:ribonuclease R [Ginsengibacter hankyongi]|uniref:Ribonuclease R n=1 Tax=Ginsengibacter hankyongi TaxID=2607284 RepID=A0A5J5IJN4_9BACT|nr:ribonuclease R [Ginsengibacter hankyongi]KAA9040981.1 ribonuclease R [Ginsengibacter hankyongi]